MRVFALIVLAYLVLALEASLLYYFRIPFHAPDLGAIIAVYLGLNLPYISAVLSALLIGFLQDGFAMGAPAGLHGTALVIICLAASSASSRLTFRSGIPVMLIAFVVAVFSQALLFVLTATFDQRVEDYAGFMDGWFVNGLVAAPFGPILFWLMQKISLMVDKSQKNRVFFQ